MEGTGRTQTARPFEVREVVTYKTDFHVIPEHSKLAWPGSFRQAIHPGRLVLSSVVSHNGFWGSCFLLTSVAGPLDESVLARHSTQRPRKLSC